MAYYYDYRRMVYAPYTGARRTRSKEEAAPLKKKYPSHARGRGESKAAARGRI
jgi:hypothetical protein